MSVNMIRVFFFFFKQKTAYEIPLCDWSSDVCSSDLDGLVLVHDTVQAERPDGRAPQRREQHPTRRVAEGVAVAPFDRLEAELGGIRIVLPLGHFDQVGTDQPAQIESRHHLE